MANLPKLTAVPAARSSLPVLKIRLVMVLGALVFSSLMGVVATFAWIANKPAPVDFSPVTPTARATAETVAEDFLAGRPLAAPLADDLSQYGEYRTGSPFAYQSLAWQSFSRSVLFTGQEAETHTFLVTYPVTTETGTVFGRLTLNVIVVIPDPATELAPYLAALPTLAPDDAKRGTGDSLYYDPSLSVAPPAKVTETITDWARAYAGNDTKALQQLTGDPETGFEYRGLGGFSVENVTVLSSVPIDDANTQFVIQARILLTAPGDFKQEMDMELTVVSADTATPRVQGWGPIGVGPVPPKTNRVPL